MHETGLSELASRPFVDLARCPAAVVVNVRPAVIEGRQWWGWNPDKSWWENRVGIQEVWHVGDPDRHLGAALVAAVAGVVAGVYKIIGWSSVDAGVRFELDTPDENECRSFVGHRLPLVRGALVYYLPTSD